MCVYLVPSAENLLCVLNKCDFPAREANLEPRLGPNKAKKNKKSWGKLNQNKTEHNQATKQGTGNKTAARTTLIKHKFNLCAILASRINFPQPKGRTKKKRKQTEFQSGTGQLGKENVLENVALLSLFIALSRGAERVFFRVGSAPEIYIYSWPYL